MSRQVTGIEPPDGLMDFSEAASVVRASRTAIWRWAHRGVRAGKGRAYLKWFDRGGRFYTTRQWIEEFYAELRALRVRKSEVAHANSIGKQVNDGAPVLRGHDDAGEALRRAGA